MNRRKVEEKLVEDKGYFSPFVSADPFQCWLPVSGDKGVLLLLVQGGHISHGKFYGLFLSRKGYVRELCMHLLSFQCLWFEIINRSRCHILGWHIPNSFNPCLQMTFNYANLEVFDFLPSFKYSPNPEEFLFRSLWLIQFYLISF